ncbi:MAG: hypothetical protein PUB55_01030 [Bacteroidales bacterium]|nr:hypothetical protein [Bacteroidales bacterium]
MSDRSDWSDWSDRSDGILARRHVALEVSVSEPLGALGALGALGVAR